MGILTPAQDAHWVSGVRAIVCAHDVIHVQGPARFVRDCLDRSMKQSQTDSVKRSFFAFMFLFVIPFAAPYMYTTFFMKHQWVYKPAEENGDVVMKNLKIDVRILQNETEAGRAGEIPAMVLTGQEFKMLGLNAGIHLGLLSLLTVFVMLAIRKVCEDWRKARHVFISSVLHFLWLSKDFPKLKYTDSTFCCIELYKWVPCAWCGTCVALVFIVPSYLAVVGNANAVLIALPQALVACWLFGKFYMQAAHATFENWLSTTLHLSANRCLFGRSLFESFLQHSSALMVTKAEFERVLENPNLEHALLHYAGLTKENGEPRTDAIDRSSSYQDLEMARRNILNGRGPELDQYAQQCMLNTFYITDPSHDVYWKLSFEHMSFERQHDPIGSVIDTKAWEAWQRVDRSDLHTNH